MTTYTPHLNLPFIEAAQAQKYVTHNAALEQLDTIVQLQVQKLGATTPPNTAQEGESWALGTDPAGVWAGQNARIAHSLGAAGPISSPVLAGALGAWQRQYCASGRPQAG